MKKWLPVPNYEGLYEVSNLGKIKSINYNHTKVEKILAEKSHKSGYKTVVLCKNGEKKNKSIHILVASAFIPNPQKKCQVNHIDGNKSNNCVENLEWVTASENIRHSFASLGKKSPNKGRFGKSHYASVQIFQYSLDGKFVRAWDCVSDAARGLNCNPSQILNNAKGRTKTCHGFMWRYEKVESIDNSPVLNRKTHKKTGL